ncbi:MAG: Lrp/AsnC family transcriptional regulator [Anaerolineales bacterium]|jgi:DNA-binding Lrp family transcriptional regulator
MKAYVMIDVRPGSIPEVVDNLRRVEGVREANMTFGPYDVVSVIETEEVNAIGRMIAREIQPIPGILDTLTCLVLDS